MSLNKNKIENIRYVVSMFFLLMIIGSVFSANVDPTRITEEKTTGNGCSTYIATEDDIGYFAYTGTGCQTVRLPKESVRKIWNDIIVKGFKVDRVESNIDPLLDRDRLIQNELLVTDPNAVAGDLAVKVAMPDGLMSPLETAALLAQSCEGPVQYGINLDSTLRIGRCEDSSLGCYTRSFGLFRQNGLTGFFPEIVSVTKDFFDMVGVNKARALAGEIITGEDSEYTIELGPFSDSSIAEINYYKTLLESTDTNELNFKKLNVITDKSVSNVIETSSFSVNMETTGRSENTFIHSYSLFDKMFNQYYSTDMIYSSSRVLLGVTTARIMRIPRVKQAYDKIILPKKDGFLKTFLENPANIILNTKRTLGKAIQAGKASRVAAHNLSNITKNGSHLLGIDSKDVYTQKIQSFRLTEKMNAYKDAIKTGNPSEVNKLLSSEDFFKGLSKQQKDVFYDLIKQNETIATMAKQHADNILKNNAQLNSALSKISEAKAKGFSNEQIYSQLTPEEFSNYKDSLMAYQDILDAVKDRGVDIRDVLNTDPSFIQRTVYTTDGKQYISESFETLGSPHYFNKESAVFKEDVAGNIFGIDGSKTNAKTIVQNYTLADGTNIKINSITPMAYQARGTQLPDLKKIEEVVSFFNTKPNGVIEAKLKSTGNIITINKDQFSAYKDLIYVDNTNFAKAYETATMAPIKNALMDPLDFSNVYLNQSHIQLTDKFPKAVGAASTYLQNTGSIDYQSLNFIDNRMKQMVDATNPFSFAAKSMTAFAYNFGYWQAKRAGADLGFLSPLGLDKFSIYRLPESYASINISHDMTPTIYNDAYIDFFANDGSDQGDLFMKFINSAIFIFPHVAKLGLEGISKSTDISLVDNAEKAIDNVLRGRIKRDTTEDIVYFTDTRNTGCGTNCRIDIGGLQYVEETTKQKSLSGLSNDLYKDYTEHPYGSTAVTTEQIREEKLQEQLASLDHQVKVLEEQYKDADFTEEEIQKIVDDYKENQLRAIQDNQLRLSYDTRSIIDPSSKLSISAYVPRGFSTQNYILEHTNPKTYDEKGQTLVTFSHHTNYSGTMEGEKTETPINLLKAIQDRETCSQKIEDLKLGGLPIGWSMPKNYRMAFTLAIAEHAAYWILPVASSPLLAPTLMVSLPKQILIMPQIKGCVDDEEGLYVHFYMHPDEYQRVEDDPTNKVADTVQQGLDTIEGTLKNITKGTEFEKTVAAGTTEAKNFVEKNFKDHAIVQSSFSTSVGTDVSVDGQLFFLELGPGTRCRAKNLNDKGVEILIDEDKKQALEIDKEKGEMNLIDDKGNVINIIDREHADFVRLVATNLGIPAKVVPLSLTYIPVSDNPETLLFEMDPYGNLFVYDNDFMACIRDGYYEQSGNQIPAGKNNLVEFLGPVKTANIINPLTQYDVYPQQDRISAQGTPRQVADGSQARLSIFGDRTSILSPIPDVKDRRINLGKNIAIQFERGQLIYSGEHNAYIMWVEYTSVTSGADIGGMRAELVSTPADNGCDDEEIAFNFVVDPKSQDPNSQGYQNVQKLNNALEKVGPFQMFDTATKTFLFYMGPPPECEQRLKIIDKITGEVYDMKVTGITETPNGFIVHTEDGMDHEFEFGAEHGVPYVRYNGDQETLLAAQGKNGAFWYDPQTGNWYTENGLLIPYDNAFKDGIMFAEGVGTPGQNVFNVGTGGAGSGSGGFNIPLSPTSPIGILIYVLFFISSFYVVQSILLEKNKKTKKNNNK